MLELIHRHDGESELYLAFVRQYGIIFHCKYEEGAYHAAKVEELDAKLELIEKEDEARNDCNKDIDRHSNKAEKVSSRIEWCNKGSLE